MALTQAIVKPVIAAAADRRRRLAGGGLLQLEKGCRAGWAPQLLLLSGVVVGVGIMLLVIGGITGETQPSAQLADAKTTMEGWLKESGSIPR